MNSYGLSVSYCFKLNEEKNSEFFFAVFFLHGEKQRIQPTTHNKHTSALHGHNVLWCTEEMLSVQVISHTQCQKNTCSRLNTWYN